MPEQPKKILTRKRLVFIFLGALILFSLLAFLLFGKKPEVVDFIHTIKDKTENKTSNDLLTRIGGSRNCQGSAPVELSALPMRREDFGVVLPYGLMVGAHVTPIDHWYFSPADRNSKRDAYPVYAMADGILSEISYRGINVDTGEKRDIEYRLVFTHTCTFLTYYDLVTSLDQSILDKATDLKSKSHARVDIPVKKGQLIGRIGGQTLDFAVWDLEKPLTGFVNPDSYKNLEPWKLYTADPYKYVSSDIKQILIERNPRIAEPIAGKIDYDIDGKLVGNWFQEGTNGYSGVEQRNYWRGHLALVYNFLDPSAIEVSIGNWKGDEGQFAVVGNKPDPASIGVSPKPTKYELTKFGYLKKDGNFWDNFSLVKDLKVNSMQIVEGTILVQLLENRKLKVETFPGKKASEVTDFTPAAKIFVR